MFMLAIETATDGCSVALLSEGKVTERALQAPREHAARVLGMVDDLVNEAGLSKESIDAIAYGKGPGSFLGTRIAATVAQSLALTWQAALIPVSSVAALATQAYELSGIEHVLVGWDARMQSIYWGEYHLVDGLMVSDQGDQLTPPDFFHTFSPDKEVALAGNAWGVYRDELPSAWSESFVVYHEGLYPKASGLLPLACVAFDQGDVVSLAEAVPVYLRHPVDQQ